MALRSSANAASRSQSQKPAHRRYRLKSTEKRLDAGERTKAEAKFKKKAAKRLANKLDKKGKTKTKVTGAAIDDDGNTADAKVKAKLTD